MVLITLGNTLGAGLLGTVAASMFYGTVVVQAYLYYHNFPDDPRFQKASVAVLLFLLSAYMALSIKTIYHYLIEDFGNISAAASAFWSFKLQAVFSSLIVLSVNSLYAVRIWKLGSNINRLWPAFVGLVALAGWAPAINLSVKVWTLETLFVPPAKQTAFNLAFGYATGTDVIIAFTICYYLERGRSTFSSINNTILKTMQYVLMCGFLTSACSVACLITLHTISNTLIFLGIAVLLPTFYINSYLALLNSRKSRRIAETEYNVTKMFVSSRPSRTERIRPSCGTFEGENSENSIRLADCPKIDNAIYHV